MTTFSLSLITSETTPSTPYISCIVIAEHQPNSANMLPSNRKQDYFKQCQRRGERNKVTSERCRLKGDIAGHAGWVIQTGVVVTSVCQNCGSRRFRADRSMAGRLVCQVCGLAADSRTKRSTIHPSGRFRQQRWRWLVGLVIVVIMIAVVMG